MTLKGNVHYIKGISWAYHNELNTPQETKEGHRPHGLNFFFGKFRLKNNHTLPPKLKNQPSEIERWPLKIQKLNYHHIYGQWCPSKQ